MRRCAQFQKLGESSGLRKGDGLEARVFKKEKSIVLELRGRVDSFHSPLIKSEIKSYMSSGKSRIALDLSQVSYLDPLCLRDWVGLHFELLKLEKEGGIALINPGKNTQELLGSAQISTIMPILTSADQINEALFPRLKPKTENSSTFRRFLRLLLKSFRNLMMIIAWVLAGKSFSPANAEPANAESVNAESVNAESVNAESVNAESVNSSPVDLQPAWSQNPSPSPALSLLEAQRIAREKSPLIRLSRARYTEKDASFEIAKKSPLPKLTSTIGYLYQSNPNALTEIINKEASSLRSGGDTNSINELQTRNQIKIDKNVFVVGMGALQVIYAGGYFDAKQSLADREKELSEIEVSISELEVDSLVREAFIGIVLMERKAELEGFRVTATEKKRDAMHLAVQTKALPKLSADQTELELLAAQRENENTLSELAEVKEKFNLLLGRTPDQAVSLSLDRVGFDALSKSGQPFEAALARNPTMAQALKRVSMAESYVNLMKSQEMFVPKVFAFGGVDHTKGIGSDARFLNWSAGLGVVIPLLDGGVQNEETRKALAIRSQAELSFQVDEAKLRQSVDLATRKRKQAIRDKTLAEKAVVIAARSLKEADEAAKNKQIPQYQYEEIHLKWIEAKLRSLAAETESIRWGSTLAGLMGAQL